VETRLEIRALRRSRSAPLGVGHRPCAPPVNRWSLPLPGESEVSRPWFQKRRVDTSNRIEAEEGNPPLPVLGCRKVPREPSGFGP